MLVRNIGLMLCNGKVQNYLFSKLYVDIRDKMYRKTIRNVNGIFISLSGGDSKPLRQYLYCKANRFPHFFYVYNQIYEYKQQLDKKNVMPKNVIIKIELVGEFTDDNLQLLPKGKVA